jgi:hypothetical protein
MLVWWGSSHLLWVDSVMKDEKKVIPTSSLKGGFINLKPERSGRRCWDDLRAWTDLSIHLGLVRHYANAFNSSFIVRISSKPVQEVSHVRASFIMHHDLIDLIGLILSRRLQRSLIPRNHRGFCAVVRSIFILPIVLRCASGFSLNSTSLMASSARSV